MLQINRWIAIFALVAAATDAFSIQPSAQNGLLSSRRTTIFRYAATETEESSSTSTDAEREELFKQIGIPEEKLALGIRPREVVKYIGSREDLITKTLNDIPSLDRTKAEAEVDKFLLDAEMLNIYIQYGKEIERDPNFKVPEPPNTDEGFFSFRTLVIAYIIFIAATTIPNVFRDYVADQQVAGTWSATGISFLDNWIDQTSPAATAEAIQRAAKAATAAASSDVVDLTEAAASKVAETVSAPMEP